MVGFLNNIIIIDLFKGALLRKVVVLKKTVLV